MPHDINVAEAVIRFKRSPYADQNKVCASAEKCVMTEGVWVWKNSCKTYEGSQYILLLMLSQLVYKVCIAFVNWAHTWTPIGADTVYTPAAGIQLVHEWLHLLSPTTQA